MILTKSVTAMRPPVDALIPRHAERGFHAGRAVRSPVPGDEYAQRPECAGINDDTTEGRAVTADELGSRVNNDISTVLNRTDEVRGTESVVDYERQTVLVRNLCDSLDIRNIGIRVAESLDVNRLSIVLDSAFQFFQIVCINEGGLNAELRQSMCQQVVAAAVDGLLSHDVVAGLSQCLDGVGDGSCTGSSSQSSHAASRAAMRFSNTSWVELVRRP